MRKSLFALTVFVLALSATSPATTFDTTSAWDGASYSYGFGNGIFSAAGNQTTATSTYGQTFIAPGQAYLQTYTSKFEYNSGGQFTFKLIIAQWSNAAQDAVGNPVFVSPTLTSLASTVTGFQDLTVTVGAQLAAGTKYVAFYTTTTEGAMNQGAMKMAVTTSDALPNGDFVDSGSNYNSLYTDAWTKNFGGSPSDTVFKAQFTSVPEPASVIALGLGAFAVLRRRRR